MSIGNSLEERLIHFVAMRMQARKSIEESDKINKHHLLMMLDEAERCGQNGLDMAFMILFRVEAIAADSKNGGKK